MKKGTFSLLKRTLVALEGQPQNGRVSSCRRRSLHTPFQQRTCTPPHSPLLPLSSTSCLTRNHVDINTRAFHVSAAALLPHDNNGKGRHTFLHDDLTSTPELELESDFTTHPVTLGPPELLNPPTLRSSIKMGPRAELRPIAGEMHAGLEYGMVWTERPKTVLILKKPNDIGTERAFLEIMR